MSTSISLSPRQSANAFTLVELLVSTAVLTLLIALVSQLFSSAASVTTLGSKRMDADEQARAMLDRMAIDFGYMVKRSDVSYFLKSSDQPQYGNDQLAFYSEVPGYYPSTTPGDQSPVSLVAYRVNSSPTIQAERMGKGLLWNGVSASDTPVVFLPLTIANIWPAATNLDSDEDYETIGPQVFRFEYYYLLKGQTLLDGTSVEGELSIDPWNAQITGHTAEEGLRDVAAIGVAIAVIDPKSRVLLSDTQLSGLAGAMTDFTASMQPGELEAQWNSAVIDSGLPRAAASAIRVYGRLFPISSSNP